MGEHDNNEHGPKGEEAVHQRTRHLGQRENVFRHIGFLKQRSVAQNRPHGRLCRGTVKFKKSTAGDEIYRVVCDLSLEHRGEHHRHDQHDQQRIQDAPYIAEKASPVFQFHIPLYQLKQKIFVLKKDLQPFFPDTHIYFFILSFQ